MPLWRVMDQLKKQEGNKRMELIGDWSATLTTNCECRSLDEEDNEITPDYCQGYCTEYAHDDCMELLEDWLERNNRPSAVIIQGVAIGWQRRSGYALIRESGDKIAAAIIDKLTLNGDFTLQFTLKGEACTISRGSHDEPTGASFTLEAFTPCDGWNDCQAVDGIKEYEGVNLCAYCHELQESN